MRHWRRLLLVIPLLVGACSGGDTPSAPAAPPTITLSAASSTLASGATVTLSATVKDAKGKLLQNASISWSSSDPQVAAVDAAGVVSGKRVGTASITATTSGASAVFGLTVVPGTPSALALRTPLSTTRSGERLATVPVIEIRDAEGNVVTGSSLTVTATLVSGSGVLGGTTTVPAAQGVVSFSDLTLRGTVGSYVLGFSASALPTLTTGPVTLTAGAPAQLAIRTAPTSVAAGAAFATAPVVEVRDAENNLVTDPVSVTASICCSGVVLSGATVTSVAGLATFSALIVAGRVGDYTLAFSSGTVRSSSSATFAIRVGAPVALALRGSPTGGGLNSPFTTPAGVEVRDAGGNVVPAPPVSVTAAVTAGGGTLVNGTAATVDGVATFTGLRIDGTPGSRTISFTATGMTGVSVAVTPCDASRGAALTLRPTAVSLEGFRLGAATSDTVRVSDTAASCTGLSGLAATVSYPGASGWLGVTTFADGRVALRATPGTLPVGTTTAVLTISATNAAPVTAPITFALRPAVTVAYGTATEKISELVVGGAWRPSTVVSDDRGTILTTPVTYTTRSPTIASVGPDGTITARAAGNAWLVARATESGALDSVFVAVLPTTGAVLRLTVSGFTYARTAPITVSVVLDTRGATIGALQALLTWPTSNEVPSLLRLTTTTPGTTGTTLVNTDETTGVTRISVVSASGFQGVHTLATFTFTPTSIGSSQFVLRVLELLTPSQQSLLTTATALQYPLVIRP